ncbi:protein cordon-bleu [Discoglossus pictus]
METIVKPPTGKKLKARAPPPPTQTTASKPQMEKRSSSESEGAGYQSSEDSKENKLQRKMDLIITLPGGQEKTVTVDGSKAVMDLLVDLCSQYHLNPAQYMLEGKHSLSQQPLTLRPNTLIGTLDMQTMCLKEKVTELKHRKPAPKIPEKTVRLVVNFLGTQKAVVRVDPAVPLRSILPAICEKCEFKNDHVCLLRDSVSKEELDMAKSLNELGIKELYAWSNKQEKNRNFSSGSESTEKEKKGILGFFRSYKRNSKNEGNVGSLDGDDFEEVFQTSSVSGNRFEGFSTAPSSPSLNSRLGKMGASQSLNNISGAGTKQEVKKRRAPPPPPAASKTVGTEKVLKNKTPDQFSGTLQNDQKKKRKAPAPPTPPMPNEKIEDKEENRKSTTGNGRQVPQKPPRGITRSPPQLEIPPPPPYPPPDHDITDPPVFENGAAVTGPAKFVPVPAKREKRLIRNNSVSSEEILTVDPTGKEETASLNSYTEDSGMVSSPSDSVSLDLQNDHSKSRKTMDAYEKYTAHSLRSDSYTSDDSWSLQTSPRRKDDEVTLVKNGDEDSFIAAQFQQTLAELDNDSEDLDDVDNAYSNHASSLSSPTSENYNPYEYEAQTEVPVTIIDEIPEDNMYSLKKTVDKPSPQKIYNQLEAKSAHTHVENKKNNFTVSSTGDILTKRIGRPNNNLTPSSSTVSQVQKSKPDDTFIPSTSFKNNYNASINIKQENGNDIRKSQPSVSSPTTQPVIIEKYTPVPESKHTIQNKLKTEVTTTPTLQSVGNKVAESAKTNQWRQAAYEPKAGLRTFTVVPPKPGIKQYDRGVSLSTSAIKIDDLGNLISPHSSINKKDIGNSLNNETEGPLVEKAKEFWRSNSMDTHAGDSKEQSVKKIIPTKSNKPNNQESEYKLSSPVSTGVTPQALVNKLNEKENGLQQPKLLNPSPIPQDKVIIIENTSKGKPDLPFQKPYKRTSSQYVASAICKYTGTSNSKSLEMTEAKQETKWDTKSLPRPSTKSIIVEEQKVESSIAEKQKSNAELKKLFSNSNNQGEDKNNKSEPLNKSKIVNEQTKINVKADSFSSEPQRFNGPQSVLTNKSITIVEKNSEKTSNLYSLPPQESKAKVASPSTSAINPFLRAVREKSSKIDQPILFVSNKEPFRPVIINEKETNSFTSNKEPSKPVVTTENKAKPDILQSRPMDEPDESANSDIFGPKAKLKPVVQKPQQKDASLHSVLMDAIQSGEGKEKLKKLQSTPTNGEDKKYAETENERDALLSAIRSHNGMSRLKKVSSAASNELETIRKTEPSVKDEEMTNVKPLSIPPPPLLPPPPPPTTLPLSPKFSPTYTNNSVDSRAELLEAIRSGSGASRLKKVSAPVHTL